MADVLEKGIVDNYKEHLAGFHDIYDEHCSECYKVTCKMCLGTGIYEKTEWVGTDDDYQIEVKCACRED